MIGECITNKSRYDIVVHRTYVVSAILVGGMSSISKPFSRHHKPKVEFLRFNGPNPIMNPEV